MLDKPDSFASFSRRNSGRTRFHPRQCVGIRHRRIGDDPVDV
jgi:hypothetical protein